MRRVDDDPFWLCRKDIEGRPFEWEDFHGAQLDRQVRDSVGADAFVVDVVSGVNQCKEWVGII